MQFGERMPPTKFNIRAIVVVWIQAVAVVAAAAVVATATGVVI